MKQFYIGTTRFTNKTFYENKRWRENHNWTGCIYGTPIPIANTPHYSKIEKDDKIFVLEMNNDTNKIEGIGYILNHIRHDFKARIYSDCNYNRYIYRSKHRLDRKQIKNASIIEFFEKVLFKGKGHLKRGQGITLIPITWNSVYNSKRGLFLPKRMFKQCVLKELKNGKSHSYIVKKYRKLQKDILSFLDNCIK